MNFKKSVLILNVLMLSLFSTIKFSHYSNDGYDMFLILLFDFFKHNLIENDISTMDFFLFIILIIFILLSILSLVSTVLYKIKLVQLNTLFFFIYWLLIAFITSNTSIFDMKLFYTSSTPFLVCWSFLVYHLFLEKRKN